MNYYNRIVLVGNGFDLALGLNSTYLNFIKYLTKRAIKETLKNKVFESQLLFMRELIPINDSTFERNVLQILEEEGPTQALEMCEKYWHIQMRFTFFQEILEFINDFNWVDIEHYYYTRLKYFHKLILGRLDIEDNLRRVTRMNLCMNVLSQELHDYLLLEQENYNFRKSQPLWEVLDKCYNSTGTTKFKERNGTDVGEPPVNTTFVNFNYTDSIQILNENFGGRGNLDVISIHGKLNDSRNRVIFGYGDDTGDEYSELESAENIEFLKLIKSFAYSRTSNYHKLLSRLEQNKYEVYIIGHSCGLSDRTLLKTIFEHENCLSVEVFHYEGEEEHFEKVIEISRHFSDKVKMREKILPFNPDLVIPQCEKKAKMEVEDLRN